MSNNWVEIKIKTTTEAVEAITNILFENGAQGAMIEDPKDFLFQKAHEYDWDYIEEDVFNTDDENVYIKTYISEENDVVTFIESIKIRISELRNFGIDIGAGEIFTDNVNEEDWANNWKKYYKPTKIGDRIVIKPEWEEYCPSEGDLVIHMDPGMAFGTGNHETTSMCIENLEKYVSEKSTVFDIGCGSGILGIVASKLGAKNVVGIDIDEMAVKVANENIQKNNVQDIMTAIVGNMTDKIEEGAKADIVVANIIADIIMKMSGDVRKLLKDDGIFISSGIILAKVDEVLENLKDNGFEVVDVIKKGEWSCVIAK
ncbi:MAG: 50S ribosomal protein L11 methyltransferase [Peptostreptococcus porci]|uniref:50S ribosomal protein L11 methyltransferase n=1 Tax=Peptostreptococcus porci TaxID=2652282 RepID=UPI002A747EC5|nr:50S ribosomal protein L11 methyltransferase [Peptostreptococcus porci]MDY2793932.1 50S ribosomal protein L11 methyltransferase [Peptostreptococcus porci]MDY5479576.1 50S ribosomal protein L11 methyltransferase [Peptostreptococcus porci]